MKIICNTILHFVTISISIEIYFYSRRFCFYQTAGFIDMEKHFAFHRYNIICMHFTEFEDENH